MNTIQVTATEAYFSYRPLTDKPLPTIIHVPGFNEDARSDAPFALRLAEVGFQCVALNPPWQNTPNLNNPSPAILYGLLDEADELLDRVLAELREESQTDMAWVALTGFSMGGMFVTRRLAQAKPAKTMAHPFRAAALILSTGDWSFLPRTTLDAFPELKALIPPETLSMIEQVLRTQSPVATPQYFPPMPLLLINADRDPRLPLDFAQSFVDALRPVYEKEGVAEALQFHVHKSKRHEFRRAMQRQVRDWLVALCEGHDK